MDENSRIIGKLEEFQEMAKNEFAEVKMEFAEIKSDIRDLQRIRWRIAGGAAALGVFVGSLVEILHFIKGD